MSTALKEKKKKENNENAIDKRVVDTFNYNVISKILLVFITLGPIFDIISFLFRNKFDSKISISTFIRPIIPLFVGIYIFFTASKKNKKRLAITAIIYLSYAICHLLVVRNLFTGCSDGTIVTEFQYICNFTFLIIDLIIYTYTFYFEGYILEKAGSKLNENENIHINEDIFQNENIESNNIETLKEKNSTEPNLFETNTEILNVNSKKYKRLIMKNIIASLSNAIVIMVAIYLFSIFISIITNTSSPTYIETNTGYKGWIESGNSLSAILVVSLFVILTSINFSKWREKNKKEKFIEIFKLITAISDFIYLATLLGTRTGLFGAFLSLICYIIVEMICSKNKKVFYAGLVFIIAGITAVSLFGSKTLKRRAEMKKSQFTIIDKSTGKIGNMTGDMLDFKNSILDGTMEDGFMSQAQKDATLDLYSYAQKHNIAGNNTRKQQLIYNIYLVKHQKSLLCVLFGNGFKTNYREMTMENELASLLLNFGVCGFILYALPFLYVLILAIENIVIEARKKESNLKNSIMYMLSLGLVITLSWFSGYVFFATSNMIVISMVVVLNLLEFQNGNWLNKKFKLFEK